MSEINRTTLTRQQVESPSVSDRELLLRHFTRDVPITADVAYPTLSKRTAGFIPSDLLLLVKAACRHALQQLQHIKTESHAVEISCQREAKITGKFIELVTKSGVQVSQSDFEASLSTMRKEQATEIGAPQIPQVSWSDIGGLAHAKKEILETIQV